MQGVYKMASSVPLLSRFKGCLVGAVLGDCLGAEFEGTTQPKPDDVLKHFQALDNRRKETDHKHVFTDDTAMARSVAKSLIHCKGFDAWDLAKRFASEYKAEPWRGYGGNVIDTLKQLDNDDLEDVFQPARAVFNGQGSYGNGGAMRIAPVPLFCHEKSLEQFKEVVEGVTKLTHTHVDAANGTLLEAYAIREAMKITGEVNGQEFLDKLLEQMKTLEPNNEERLNFTQKLEKAKQLLEEDSNISSVVQTLGHDISALGSVPAAILSFLKGLQAQPIEPIPQKFTGFEKTLIYAVMLGGDTDTIASMAGAISGAYYGIDAINATRWQVACEGVTDAIDMAEQLYNIVMVYSVIVNSDGNEETDQVDKTEAKKARLKEELSDSPVDQSNL